MSEAYDPRIKGVIEINGLHVNEKEQNDFLLKTKAEGTHIRYLGNLANAGVASVEGEQVQTGVHRVMWAIFNGGIERDRRVRRTCGEPWCVRPAHLEAEPTEPDPEAMALFWQE